MIEVDYANGNEIQVTGEADVNEIGIPASSVVQQPLDITVGDPSDPARLPEEAEYPAGAKFWLIMLTVGAVLVLSSIDVNVVATAVPSITDHFHTVADVGW